MGFGNIVSDALNIMRDEKKFYKDYFTTGSNYSWKQNGGGNYRPVGKSAR